MQPLSDPRVRERLEALVRFEFSVGPTPLTAATRLREDLLLDSLALVELVMVVEDEFSIGVGDADLADVRTFGDLCREVTERLH